MRIKVVQCVEVKRVGLLMFYSLGCFIYTQNRRNALLIIIIIPLISGCENSDGLFSFHVSHEGYFSNGDTLIEKNGTTVECAKKCRKDIRCVAFSYQQFGECYHYHEPQALTTIQVNDIYIAYIKCTGRLVFCVL